MPVEIRELVIRAVIDESGEQSKSDSDSQLPDREEIIADCVEQVMQILQEQAER